MKLVSFSVTNYRSITRAHRLPLSDSTILIGPNNEGKSNILEALVTALSILRELGRVTVQTSRIKMGFGRFRDLYDWDRDFPISLQEKKPSGQSIFRLEFELSDAEVADFRSEVGSNLNGTLPIELSVSSGKPPAFKVSKKGPGGPALSKKAAKIAQYVGRRVDFEYIPAVRTADAAERVVEQMVSRELSRIEQEEEYQAALTRLEELQQPVLDELSKKIAETLQSFLPNVQSAEVRISSEKRHRALRRSCEIVVDDGTPTLLARKGHGVQSLAALSLLRGARQSRAGERDLILAIEEPESHLHPNAIHRLRQVIEEISQEHQVILTTHCPLFVDRSDLDSNILVTGNKARPAKKIEEIRDLLGVRAADNLMHAELVLVVEGECDRLALKSLLACHSTKLKSALGANTLVLDPLFGATNLSYKLSQLRDALCKSHIFLDYDKAAKDISDRASHDGNLVPSEINYATCQGMGESEIEDMYDTGLYADMVKNVYGVDLNSSKFKSAKKWSERAEACFHDQGRNWDKKVSADLKTRIAELVETSPSKALNSHKRSAFDALVSALEARILAA